MTFGDKLDNPIKAMEIVPKFWELNKNWIGVIWSFFLVLENVLSFVLDRCINDLVRFIEESEVDAEAAELEMNVFMTFNLKGHQAALLLLNNELLIDAVIGCIFKYPNTVSIQGAACDVISNVALDNYLWNNIISHGNTRRIVYPMGELIQDLSLMLKMLMYLATSINGANV